MKYSMIVYSNPKPGREEEYLRWYKGQHIHDMLNVPGYVGCRFYRLTQVQLNGTREEKNYQYVIVWDMEADDFRDIIREIEKRRETQQITYSDPFDRATYCTVCTPVTDYIRAEDIVGKTPEQVLEMSDSFVVEGDLF